MTYQDQTGNFITLNKKPKRIISVVPSQTELLYDLGLDEEVIGITKYCVHPTNWHETKTKVGGTKKLDIDKIKSLNPDLIIANKEENEKNQIQELMKEFPVWVSNISNLEQALTMIEAIGAMTGKEMRSLEIQNNIREQFSHFKIQAAHIPLKKTRVLYLIWRKPYISAGNDTFIGHLLNVCGLKNIVESQRYPKLPPEKIKQLNPELIFLSSEPYPFRKKHLAEFQLLCPAAQIVFVDGEMFSWYGSRLIYAPCYFERLLTYLT